VRGCGLPAGHVVAHEVEELAVADEASMVCIHVLEDSNKVFPAWLETQEGECGINQ